VSAPIQHAAVRAYPGGPEIDDYLARSRAVLAALLGLGWQALVAAGAEVCEPRGGFYLFPDFERHREALQRAGIGDSPALCERLLEETGVATLPGTDFGLPPEALILRLALVDFDGAAVIANLGSGSPRAAENYRVDEACLEKYCAATVAGVRRVCSWVGGVE
jgi:aspartate aminotransferase